MTYFAARRHLLDGAAFHAKEEEEENVERLVADLPKWPKRVLERVCKDNTSSWLAVGPSKQYGFDYPGRFFATTSLNFRHRQEELRGLPSVCDGCGTFQFVGARPELYDERGGDMKL